MGLGYRETVKTVRFQGWVADFCPICRCLQPFLLRSSHWIESEVHLVAIVPIAHDRELGLAGHDRVCDACGFCTPARPEDYAAVAEEKPGRIDELLQRTQPQARERYADRLALEADVAGGDLDPERRRALLAETLRSLDPHLCRVLPAPIRRWHWLVPLSVLAASMLLGTAIDRLPDGSPLGILVPLAAVGGVLGLAGVGIRAWLRPAFVRRALVLEAFPLLVRAWTPLRPTREELQEAVEEARRGNGRLARDLSIDRLLIELPPR